MTKKTEEQMDIVDIAEIAKRLEVSKLTVYQWGRRRTATGYPLPDFMKSGNPLWMWGTIEVWARETNRIWD